MIHQQKKYAHPYGIDITPPYVKYLMSWDKPKYPLGFIDKADFNQNNQYKTIRTIVKATKISLASVSIIGQTGCASTQIVLEE